MPRMTKPLPEALTLGDALAAWDRSLRVGGKSARTVKAYAYASGKLVERVTAAKPLHRITTEDIESLLIDLADGGMTPAGRSTVYRPLRTFFGWCVKREYLTKSPVDAVAAPKVVVQPVEFVTDDEWAAILRTTVERSKHAYRARRDRAILLMLATTGARLSEVANLTLADVDLAL